MKNFYYLITLCIIFFISSCQRFDPPEIRLQMTMNPKDSSAYNFYATILDGGGVYFNQKGYVYGLNKNPTHMNSECISDSVSSNPDDWFFHWSMSVDKYFPIEDTFYYVCGWVRTNAGTGYSNAVRIDRYSYHDTIK